MNDISVLPTSTQTPDYGKVLAATKRYTQTWQRETFKFIPLLHESLARHMQLFIACRQGLARNAQRLIAELRNDPLRDILDALGEGEPDELLSLAQETLQDVRTKLAAQLAHARGEHRALAGLPVYDTTADRSRIQADLGRGEVSQRQLAALLEQHQEQLDSLEAAIRVFEENGLQTRFEGVIPSTEQLAKLAAPGGEALLTAEAIGKAIERLETLFGDLAKGMRFSQLLEERAARARQIGEVRQNLRQLSQRKAEQANWLETLATLPALLELRSDWASGMDRICIALENFHDRLQARTLASDADVRALQNELRALLTYQAALMQQDRDAF